ncbi:MAG UNVERIFIED_CONTAM: VCBS repeat-containing protein [Planctomycetaceae bacterium]
MTRYGHNQLYRNLGDGTFEELGAAWGADDNGWATSAAIFDANHDSLADIYVCNYGQWTWETSQYCGDRTRNLRHVLQSEARASAARCTAGELR